jgi:hydrophobe/amphiphile efflux-1 (HAE1) family protein
VIVSRLFIRRPVATSLLAVGVVLAGLLGYSVMPISALPEVAFPTIQVTTFLPGASPDTMASLVTTPLERQFGQIPGLDLMTSTSSAGTSVITLQFILDREIEAAAEDVQAAINAAGGVLPHTLPAPPTYNKVNPADAPVLILALTSDTLPLTELNDAVDSVVAQKLSRVNGVGLVTIEGNQKPAVRVRLNPAKLTALGLSLEAIRTALGTANVNQPKGSFDGTRQSYTIAANDQIASAKDYAPVVVAYRNGAPVRLSDLGDVQDGAENAKIAGWYQGQPAVILDVLRQPGANIIATVDTIRKLLPQLQKALRPGIKISILTDRTQTIRASVRDVQFTLVLTAALVVMVIFLFLRKLWATVIPGVALPMSVVATFGVMALAGYSLDNLSLMALTIASGFIVDDAIVMIENIVRFIEAGDSPMEAALKGAAQIGFTIISLTVSLVAVFIPLLFMTGIVGRLFREFAMTLAISVVLSAVVSLTLTPMMCSRLLKADHGEKEGAFGRALEGGFEWLLRLYERTLAVVMRHRKLTLLVAVGTLVGTLVLYIYIPKGFLPQQDTGMVIGTTEAAQNISFSAMSQLQQEMMARVQQDPDVQGVAAFVGAGTVNPTLNVGRMYIQLKPREERSTSAAEVMARLRQRTGDVTGMSLFLQMAQDIQIDTRQGRSQYQYTLVDANVDELREWAPKLLEALRQRPELSDVGSDQQSQGNELSINIDRDAAGRLNVLPQAIDDTLYDAFGQRQVSIIYSQLNQYRVILEVEPMYQASPDSLSKLYVPSTTGQQVPLSAVASISRTTAALAVPHQGQFPAVTLSFNLAPGVSLSQAVKSIKEEEQKLEVPDSVQRSFFGATAEFQTSLASEPFLLLAAIIVVYIVLGVLYESYVHPLTIISTLPSAGVGALLALWVTGNDLSLVAIIGIVLLIGIVKKNAIMMIDFALEAEREGHKTPDEAIFQACLLRFRPIMMTTMAALLGAVPLAFGTGVGSELRRPLGISIIGGLVLSQVLTLYTTPVIYLYLDKASRWWARRRGTPHGPAPHPSPVPSVEDSTLKVLPPPGTSSA